MANNLTWFRCNGVYERLAAHGPADELNPNQPPSLGHPRGRHRRILPVESYMANESFRDRPAGKHGRNGRISGRIRIIDYVGINKAVLFPQFQNVFSW